MIYLLMLGLCVVFFFLGHEFGRAAEREYQHEQTAKRMERDRRDGNA